MLIVESIPNFHLGRILNLLNFANVMRFVKQLILMVLRPLSGEICHGWCVENGLKPYRLCFDEANTHEFLDPRCNCQRRVYGRFVTHGEKGLPDSHDELFPSHAKYKYLQISEPKAKKTMPNDMGFNSALTVRT